ncbi:MAG TPA: DUF4880 domain-containing protein [Alcaligenes faecalis]|nr:DUF4880 domain-containing protein [Alcaligenes faecalis]
MGTHQGEFLDQTQAQAAYWFTRLNSGEATAAELREFEDWRRANPEHERCYRYICYFCDASLDASEQELKRLLPRLGTSTDDAIVVRPRRLWVGGLVLVTVAVGAWFWPEPILQEEYIQATSSMLERHFPDGTIVLLEPDSEVRVKRYAESLEVILMRGAVALSVDHQDKQSVEVDTGFAQAHTHKAQFRVNVSDKTTRVQVQEGSVEVAGGSWWRRQVRVLMPGQHVDVDRWAGMRRVQPAPAPPPEAD